MRTLAECKAEVFRRSHRIRENRRKTGKRVLAAGIPIALCIGIWIAAALPGTKAPTADYLYNGTDGNIYTGSVCIYSEAELLDSQGDSQKITDAERVSALFLLIQSFDTEAAAGIPGGKTEQPDAGENHSSAPDTELLIVFSGADGQTYTYTLSGSSLTNSETGKQLSLSDTQLTALWAALSPM